MSISRIRARGGGACVLAAVVSLLAGAQSATAQQWSVEAFGGVRLSDTLEILGTDVPVDPGSTFGVRGFYSHGASPLSFGLEYSRTEAEYDLVGTAYSQSTAVFALFRYTMEASGPTSGYVTGGVGQIEVDMDVASFPLVSGSESEFGASLALGVNYDMTDRFSLFGEFQHQRSFSKSDPSAMTGVEFRSNNILLGARFNF